MASDAPTPIVPDYRGASITNLVPALVQHPAIGQGWIPDDVLDAPRAVLFVLDGLGYDQLAERAALAPTLWAMTRRSITSVAPTTTATALTSITTGVPPGEHGVVGHRIRLGTETLNALRWSTELGDARQRIDPTDLQPVEPFGSRSTEVVSPAAFVESGLTAAHLRGVPYRPYWLTSSLPVEVAASLDSGARFVYAYYDGIDKIAHIAGFGEHYDAELAEVDRLVAAVAASLPAGTALVVTADHGQVHVGDRVVPLAAPVLGATAAVSGEPRFVWLHARAGRQRDLAELATEHHGDHAWVLDVDQVLDESWFGPVVAPAARARLGDVALVTQAPVALVDPARPGPTLECRHGALTRAETLVPLGATVV